MNLTELIAAVYVETNRPDLSDQTRQSIKAQTLAMHGMDLFPDDILNGQVAFDTAQWIQQFDRGILTRFRKLAYARKWNPADQASALNPLLPPNWASNCGDFGWCQRNGFIKFQSPDDLLNSYGGEKVDVGYLAGRNILIRSSTQFQFLLTGWYAFPDVSDDGFSSWVADEYPYAIVYGATSQILQTVGQLDSSRMYDRPATDTHDGGLVQNQIKRILADKILVDQGNS